MPKDSFIREKFTRERSAARKFAQEYFERYPKDRYQTAVESLAQSAVGEYRVHDEAATRADRGGSRVMKCSRCEDCGWVCENHPERSWEGEHACTCGGAGMPCPRCNEPKGTRRRGCRRASRLSSTKRAGAISDREIDISEY